jgi:ABC-2 type transport system permease protein
MAFKEFIRIRRDKRLVQSIIGMQLLNFGTIAFLDTSLREVPTVIVDQDRTAESREFVSKLTATQTFNVRYSTSSTEQARSHIRAGEAKVAVVLPPEFGLRRASGADASVLALVDGSNSVVSLQITSALEGLAAKMSAHARTEDVPVIEARRTMLFNPESRVANFMLPGLLALVLANTYGFRALSLAVERESGHLERLLMAPINFVGLIIGKLLPVVLLALVNALAFVLFARFGFGVPLRGSALALALATVGYSLTFTALAMFVSATSKTEADAFGNYQYFQIPLVMLTGYIFPVSSLPRPLQLVSFVLPETHFIEITRGICLRGATLLELAPHVAFLLIAPIPLLWSAAYRFSRSTQN